MSQPSSSESSFQVLFNTALQEYENQTGTNLVDHPFAKQLEECDSVDSVVIILQEQSQSFREFRGDGRLMKSLVCSVDVLYTMSTNTALGEGIGLVRPKALIGVRCS
jgi:predicted  nucleic acid-binding Zn ribbon protein